MHQTIVEIILQYKALLDAGTSILDSLAVTSELEKFEDADSSKPFLLLCIYDEMTLFTKYDHDIDQLLDLANAICTHPELKEIDVTIFQATQEGGTALFVHSPLGMRFQEN